MDILPITADEADKMLMKGKKEWYPAFFQDLFRECGEIHLSIKDLSMPEAYALFRLQRASMEDWAFQGEDTFFGNFELIRSLTGSQQMRLFIDGLYALEQRDVVRFTGRIIKGEPEIKIYKYLALDSEMMDKAKYDRIKGKLDNLLKELNRK